MVSYQDSKIGRIEASCFDTLVNAVSAMRSLRGVKGADYQTSFRDVRDYLGTNCAPAPEICLPKRKRSRLANTGGAPCNTSCCTPGMSAYEVAVADGFVGTVDEWLDSLKGESWGGIGGDIQDQTDLIELIDSIPSVGNKGSITVSGSGDTWTINTGAVKNSMLAGGISLSKLATNPLARANHTGTQAHTTITGLGTLATQNGTFSGTSSGTNTGDQDLSAYATTASLSVYALTSSLGTLATQNGTFSGTSSGTNTGDQDLFTTAYTAKTSNYTLTISDSTVECTANSFTITLLTAVGITGRVFNIKNSGNGVVTIATTAGQTIDGYASGIITLPQYTNLKVQSNGTNWIIL